MGWLFRKTIVLLAYILMLLLVFIYFSGKGVFIYEGF
jgi:hypothetical protein